MLQAERAATGPGVLDDGVMGQRGGRCGHGRSASESRFYCCYGSASRPLRQRPAGVRRGRKRPYSVVHDCSLSIVELFNCSIAVVHFCSVTNAVCSLNCRFSRQINCLGFVARMSLWCSGRWTPIIKRPSHVTHAGARQPYRRGSGLDR
ncbi:hypothetical protein D3C86_1695930 [compost metagenome]